MPLALMASADSVLAVTKVKISGVTAIIFVVIISIIIVAVVYTIRHAKRSRQAPPDDWDRNPAQRRQGR